MCTGVQAAAKIHNGSRSDHSDQSSDRGRCRSQLSCYNIQTMSAKPHIAMNNYKRRRSGSSVCSDSSPIRSSENENVQLGDRISSAGGFTSLAMGGELLRNIYVFPTKLVSSEDRENIVTQFVAKIYNFGGDYNDDVNKPIIFNILQKYF